MLIFLQNIFNLLTFWAFDSFWKIPRLAVPSFKEMSNNQERTQSEHVENQCLVCVSVHSLRYRTVGPRRAKKYPCAHLSSSAHGGALRKEGERESRRSISWCFSHLTKFEPLNDAKYLIRPASLSRSPAKRQAKDDAYTHAARESSHSASLFHHRAHQMCWKRSAHNTIWIKSPPSLNFFAFNSWLRRN